MYDPHFHTSYTQPTTSKHAVQYTGSLSTHDCSHAEEDHSTLWDHHHQLWLMDSMLLTLSSFIDNRIVFPSDKHFGGSLWYSKLLQRGNGRELVKDGYINVSRSGQRHCSYAMVLLSNYGEHQGWFSMHRRHAVVPLRSLLAQCTSTIYLRNARVEWRQRWYMSVCPCCCTLSCWLKLS